MMVEFSKNEKKSLGQKLLKLQRGQLVSTMQRLILVK